MSSAPVSKSRLDVVADNVRSALGTQSVPDELVNALVESLRTMSKLYMQNDLRPSELNAGDFIEAVVRILQWLSDGKYTPLKRSIPSMPKWVEDMEKTKLNDGLRIGVPKLLNAMYAVRSRRGVSHIAGEVSANRVDAMLLLTNSRWILAEFVRLYHKSDHDEAQRAVDLLALAQTPIIEDFEGINRVITSKPTSIPDQVLLLLLHAVTSEMAMADLTESIKAKPAVIKQAIKRLDAKSMVHIYDNQRVKLTGLGRADAAKTMAEIQEKI
jgi:hypothetical protein